MTMTVLLTGLAAGILLAFAALAAERVTVRLCSARRWAWVAALVLTLGLVALSPWSSTMIRLVMPEPSTPGVTAFSWFATAPGLDAAVLRAGGLNQSVMPRLAVAWALMSGAVAGWYLLGGLTLMKRRGRWHREVVGDIAVLVSRETGPAVFGLLRPAIVVPRWALAMRTQALAFVLRHEEEHIAARDQWLLLLAHTATVVMPWHPGVWLMSRRLRRAIELDCDARVLRSHKGADSLRIYCEALLGVAARSSHMPPFLPAMFHSSSSLRTRIDAMTGPADGHRGSVRILSAIATAAVLVVVAAAVPVQLAAARERPALGQDEDRRQPVPFDTPGLVPPVPQSEVKPQYTPEALRERIEGVVHLALVIDVDGKPRDVRVAKSVDVEHGLDAEAVDAVQRWTFRPARIGDEAVPVEVMVQMEFSLRE